MTKTANRYRMRAEPGSDYYLVGLDGSVSRLPYYQPKNALGDPIWPHVDNRPETVGGGTIVVLGSVAEQLMVEHGWDHEIVCTLLVYLHKNLSGKWLGCDKSSRAWDERSIYPWGAHWPCREVIALSDWQLVQGGSELSPFCYCSWTELGGGVPLEGIPGYEPMWVPLSTRGASEWLSPNGLDWYRRGPKPDVLPHNDLYHGKTVMRGEEMKILRINYPQGPCYFVDQDGYRLTDCCQALSSYDGAGTLCCKRCYREVEEGQGDGEEKFDLSIVDESTTTELEV